VLRGFGAPDNGPGWLILTTPQVANLRNILDLLHGRNIYGRYELVFGTTWRHNREYTRREVVDLLETTGFRAESAAVEDAHPALGSASLARRLLLRLLRRLYGQEYGDQLYVRARPQRQFHWTYPRWLFEHADLHVVARYDYVRVGENDALQLGLGWGACEPDGHTGELVRTITGEHADALIKTNPGATRLAFELHRRSPHPQSLRLQVSPHPSGAAAADQHVDVTLQHDHETILVDVPHTATAAALRIHIRTSPGSVALRSLRWVE